MMRISMLSPARNASQGIPVNRWIFGLVAIGVSRLAKPSASKLAASLPVALSKTPSSSSDLLRGLTDAAFKGFGTGRRGLWHQNTLVIGRI
jgi:hypothetical protein